MTYLKPKLAAEHLLSTLKKDFPDGEGGVDVRVAAKTIFGIVDDSRIRSMQSVVDFPTCNIHSYLVWDYVGLRLTSVFEKNGRINCRSSS